MPGFNNAIMKAETKEHPIYNLNNSECYSGLNLEVLPLIERTELERRGSTLKIRKKAVLYRESETSKGLYIIVKGKVKFFSVNPDGSERIYFIYGPGDMFGYRPILSGTSHAHSVAAIEDCELLLVEKQDFIACIERSKQLSKLFLDSACKDFTLLTNIINVLTRKSIKERTAYFLLLLNEKFKLPGQLFDEAEIRISRGDLASYIGASVENLIRTIKEFKDKNYIHLDGKSIYIRDFDALYAITNHEMAKELTE